MNEEQTIGKGDVVRTDGESKPVSTGIVQSVSECGRYVRVEKVYGQRNRRSKTYDRSSLTVLSKAK
jgi:hypothetical protein